MRCARSHPGGSVVDIPPPVVTAPAALEPKTILPEPYAQGLLRCCSLLDSASPRPSRHPRRAASKSGWISADNVRDENLTDDNGDGLAVYEQC